MNSSLLRDPHSEQGSNCPKNKFGITSYVELAELEAPLAAIRGGELEDSPITGDFDLKHLQAIHKYLFQDVFPWAGEFRAVDISKGTSNFGPAMHLHGALEDALAKLKRESFLTALTAPAFAQRAAFYLGEINAIHPFREGNGRTQREFIRQLALSAGHPLAWIGFTQAEMIEASIASHTRGDNAGLASILERAIEAAR